MRVREASECHARQGVRVLPFVNRHVRRARPPFDEARHLQPATWRRSTSHDSSIDELERTHAFAVSTVATASG